MKTEDDTFKKLCKYTYEELYAKIVEHYATCTDITITYDHILAEAGWTYKEYVAEWDRRISK